MEVCELEVADWELSLVKVRNGFGDGARAEGEGGSEEREVVVVVEVVEFVEVMGTGLFVDGLGVMGTGLFVGGLVSVFSLVAGVVIGLGDFARKAGLVEGGLEGDFALKMEGGDLVDGLEGSMKGTVIGVGDLALKMEFGDFSDSLSVSGFPFVGALIGVGDFALKMGFGEVEDSVGLGETEVLEGIMVGLGEMDTLAVEVGRSVARLGLGFGVRKVGCGEVELRKMGIGDLKVLAVESELGICVDSCFLFCFGNVSFVSGFFRFLLLLLVISSSSSSLRISLSLSSVVFRVAELFFTLLLFAWVLLFE